MPNKKPRKYIYSKNHFLANKIGRVSRARLYFYEAVDGKAGRCYWCGIKLNWKNLCVDHLDSNSLNDNPVNLVGSCRGCNANRDDGTGHGRRKPKVCKNCGLDFVSEHIKTQIYCSNKCAQMNRPKRGTKTRHGTRSRYVFGCRCQLCTKENSTYNKKLYYEKLKK